MAIEYEYGPIDKTVNLKPGQSREWKFKADGHIDWLAGWVLYGNAGDFAHDKRCDVQVDDPRGFTVTYTPQAVASALTFHHAGPAGDYRVRVLNVGGEKVRAQVQFAAGRTL